MQQECLTLDSAELDRRTGRSWIPAVLADRGRILVKTLFHAWLGVPIRPSVQTSMAVGQVGIFRSVRKGFLDGWKNVRSARPIGIRTVGRFGSARRARKAVLTRKVGRPGFREAGPVVAFGIGQALDMDRRGNDPERL